jgi:hypothetical protein
LLEHQTSELGDTGEGRERMQLDDKDIKVCFTVDFIFIFI